MFALRRLLGNKYYYDILVLNTNFLNNKKDSKSILRHTIRELNENKNTIFVQR